MTLTKREELELQAVKKFLQNLVKKIEQDCIPCINSIDYVLLEDMKKRRKQP